MPTHEPELSDPYYEGTFYEGGHGNPDGAVIQYLYTEDDGYSYDPDAPGEVEWLSEAVASGPEIDWSTGDGKRNVAVRILTHLFLRDPTEDELDLFMTEFASKLTAGSPFEVSKSDLISAGLSNEPELLP